jgi:hypothetical protein
MGAQTYGMTAKFTRTAAIVVAYAVRLKLPVAALHGLFLGSARSGR